MEDPEFVILVRKVSPSMHKHIKDIVRVPRFEKVIASKRRSSLIDTFEEFVTVLIKRDFIDPSNKSTWSLLDEVCLEFEGRRFYDVSKQMPMDNDVRVPSITHYSHTNGFGGVSSPQLDPRVIDYLSSHISQFSWRNFARGLKVREGDIATIEVNHEKDPSRCVKEVLNIYLNQLPWNSSGHIREDILTALERLGRNDLIHNFKKLTASINQQPIHFQ